MREPTERTLSNNSNQSEGWHGRTVYQIYPNTFHEVRPEDQEHTGRGSIRGIIEKIPYLANLGVKAIWLSPFYQSPLVDGGYDVSDYYTVDPGLGTLEDAQELFAAAKEHDIRSIVDIVPNHTSDQHEWFQQSCQHPTGPWGDAYYWADPRPLQPGEPVLPQNIAAGNRLDGLPSGFTVPNNWSSIFSEPEADKLKQLYGGHIPEEVEVPAVTAWVWHQGRQQFYLAEFAKEQPSLNWHNPRVREEMKDVFRFWIENGVDGFRVDVMNHIGKDPLLTDEAPVPPGTFNKNTTNPHDQWEQERLVSCSPYLENFADELIGVLDEYPDRDLRLIIEDWIAALSTNDKLSSRRPDKATVFNFSRLLLTNRENWQAHKHKQSLDSYYRRRDIAAGLPNQVDSNHDVDRVVTRIGSRPALAAAAIKLTTPGTPYIFQGEEGGLPNVPYEHIPIERRKDKGLAFRDGERCPIPWNATERHAGFSDAPEEQLWLPIDPRYRDLNLEDQTRDPRSFWRVYQALLHLRNTSSELSHGAYIPLNTDHSDILAFSRSHPEGERRLFTTVANFAGNTQEVAVVSPQHALARVVLSTVGGVDHDWHHPVDFTRGHLRLAPHETLVLESVA